MKAMMTLVRIGVCLLEDVARWLVLLARSTESVRAENLVLRRQLAMFLERVSISVKRVSNVRQPCQQFPAADRPESRVIA
jgi:hypothetical protein